MARFNPMLSHTKESKMVLDTSLLKNHHYKVRIKDKVGQSGEIAPSPTFGVVVLGMAVQKKDDQHEHTFSSYVRIRDVILKTCLGR